MNGARLRFRLVNLARYLPRKTNFRRGSASRKYLFHCVLTRTLWTSGGRREGWRHNLGSLWFLSCEMRLSHTQRVGKWELLWVYTSAWLLPLWLLSAPPCSKVALLGFVTPCRGTNFCDKHPRGKEGRGTRNYYHSDYRAKELQSKRARMDRKQREKKTIEFACYRGTDENLSVLKMRTAKL